MTNNALNETPALQEDVRSIDDLFSLSLEYRGSAAYKRFFEFIARFNHYSRYNTMLVYVQNPAVTFFGSTSYWKKNFARQIKPGAKPLVILAPKGPVILAYDIMETIGVLSAEEFLNKGIGRRLFEVGGDFKEWYMESFENFAAQYGIKIIRKPLSFFNAGAVTTYISKKLEIYLREGNTVAEQFSTLCHELAHILLGHTGHIVLRHSDARDNIKLIQRTKHPIHVEELEAETVNYLLCKRFGLKTSSLEYLAGYIKDDGDWKNFSYEIVIKVADRLEGILKSYRPK